MYIMPLVLYNLEVFLVQMSHSAASGLLGQSESESESESELSDACVNTPKAIQVSAFVIVQLPPNSLMP